MFALQIKHSVRDFDVWKKAFDNYNSSREESQVCRYRIFQSLDDPNHITINLDFDHSNEVDTFLSAMLTLWGRVEGILIDGSKARISRVLGNEHGAKQAA